MPLPILTNSITYSGSTVTATGNFLLKNNIPLTDDYYIKNENIFKPYSASNSSLEYCFFDDFYRNVTTNLDGAIAYSSANTLSPTTGGKYEIGRPGIISLTVTGNTASSRASFYIDGTNDRSAMMSGKNISAIFNSSVRMLYTNSASGVILMQVGFGEGASNTTPNYSAGMFSYTGGNFRCQAATGSNTVFQFNYETNTPLQTGQWYNLMVVYNGNNNTSDFYINRNLVYSYTGTLDQYKVIGLPKYRINRNLVSSEVLGLDVDFLYWYYKFNEAR